MQVQRAQRYVPDFEDNRARFARGEPAVTIMLRPPTARVWRQFWLGMASKKREIPEHLKQAMGGDEQAVSGLAMYLSTLDDSLAEVLFLGCVQTVDWPENLTPGVRPTTAQELWAARDSLSSFVLFQNIIEACINNASLSEGLESFLASRPGPAVSTTPENTGVGTAAIVASGAST